MTSMTSKAKQTLVITLLGASVLSTSALAKTPKAQESVLQVTSLPVQLERINKNINDELNVVIQKQTLQQLNNITNELSEQISVTAHSVMTNNINH